MHVTQQTDGQWLGALDSYAFENSVSPSVAQWRWKRTGFEVQTIFVNHRQRNRRSYLLNTKLHFFSLGPALSAFNLNHLSVDSSNQNISRTIRRRRIKQKPLDSSKIGENFDTRIFFISVFIRKIWIFKVYIMYHRSYRLLMPLWSMLLSLCYKRWTVPLPQFLAFWCERIVKKRNDVSFAFWQCFQSVLELWPVHFTTLCCNNLEFPFFLLGNFHSYFFRLSSLKSSHEVATSWRCNIFLYLSSKKNFNLCGKEKNYFSFPKLKIFL